MNRTIIYPLKHNTTSGQVLQTTTDRIIITTKTLPERQKQQMIHLSTIELNYNNCITECEIARISQIIQEYKDCNE